MERLSAKIREKTQRPVKVLQFGEGNFLRAFVDTMIDIANENGAFDGGIVLVKPITFGSLDMFREQDCLYTVILRGMTGGEKTVQMRLITSVDSAVDAYTQYDEYAAYAKQPSLRFIVSNTTEAGITLDETDRFELTPPNTYPGKLTKFLFERGEAFNYAEDKGLIIVPVELIDDNGIELKRCVMALAQKWALGDRFIDWLNGSCVFTSTLVDRIVTGYPRGEEDEIWPELGYEDKLMVTGEPFSLWVIESGKDISGEFPLDKAGNNVIFTDNQKPYKQRKVRILNGAHTSFVPAAFLCGYDDVLSAMRAPMIAKFMQGTLYDEVIPTLHLPKDDLLAFAEAVTGRFSNPFIKHALLSICLNSVSKWRARCLPSLEGYIEIKGALPPRLTFSLAALIALYEGGKIADNGALICTRDGQSYELRDDASVLKFFEKNSGLTAQELTKLFLAREDFFGRDLNAIPGLTGAVGEYLADIRLNGMTAAMERVVNGGSAA